MTITLITKLSGALVAGGVCTTLAATMEDEKQRKQVEVGYWVMAMSICALWEGSYFYYNNYSLSPQFFPFLLALIFGGVMTSLAAKEEEASKRQPYLIAYWVVAAVAAAALYYYRRKQQMSKQQMLKIAEQMMFDANIDDRVDRFMTTDDYYRMREEQQSMSPEELYEYLTNQPHFSVDPEKSLGRIVKQFPVQLKDAMPYNITNIQKPQSLDELNAIIKTMSPLAQKAISDNEPRLLRRDYEDWLFLLDDDAVVAVAMPQTQWILKNGWLTVVFVSGLVVPDINEKFVEFLEQVFEYQQKGWMTYEEWKEFVDKTLSQLGSIGEEYQHILYKLTPNIIKQFNDTLLRLQSEPESDACLNRAVKIVRTMYQAQVLKDWNDAMLDIVEAVFKK